jgi:hypothetical protein
VDVFGRPQAAGEIDDVDRPTGAGDDEDAIAEIGGVAHGRLDRIVGEHAADDQRRCAERVERLFETRADEGAVSALADADDRDRVRRRDESSVACGGSRSGKRGIE